MEDVCEGKDFNFPLQEEKVLVLQKTAGADIVTRFQTANGCHVTRRFGWDCHGLPVEFEINQKLNIKSTKDVLNMGIDIYNEECRAIVMRYSKEWETVVTRLVYRGFKVMPYSVGCITTLSNFEAGLNYKDVSDPSIMISFLLLEDVDGVPMVAWTPTPWTLLPSNLALCVNPNFTYVKAQCKVTGAIYMVAESLLSQLPIRKGKVEVPNGDVSKVMDTSVNSDNPKSSDKKSGEKKAELGGYKILARMSGSELAGKRYQPLFDYFLELSTFGEDDYRVCLNAGIIDSVLVSTTSNQ
ncbi:hypothetical protein GOP47_0028606 [Adiantum capillus-veneris]|nr:hypothetical protein GOP47_0028606 [Adiantum capillus-veneris]